MTDSEKDNENIFKIMDGIITQLNKTKKMFIIMILTIMIISPITFLISFAIWGPPFESEQREHERLPQGFFPKNHSSYHLTCMAWDWNKAVVCTF